MNTSKFNALAASIEDALKTGKCDDNEKDIKAEIEKINAAIKKIWDKLDELTTTIIVSTSDLSE